MSSWATLQAELDRLYLQEGLTLKDFCRLRGINYKTGWRHLISPLSRSPERHWIPSEAVTTVKPKRQTVYTEAEGSGVNAYRPWTFRLDSLRRARKQRQSSPQGLDEALPSRPVCGAKAKGSGRACRNAPGFKTRHPGEGRCFLHGGVTGGAPTNNINALYHGAYSRFVRKNYIRFTPDEFTSLIMESNPYQQYVAFVRAEYDALCRMETMFKRYYIEHDRFEAASDVFFALLPQMHRLLKLVSRFKLLALYRNSGTHFEISATLQRYLAGIGVYEEGDFIPTELLDSRTRWET